MATGSDEERKSAASRGWTVEGPSEAPEPVENFPAEEEAGPDSVDSGEGAEPSEGPRDGQMSNLTVVMLGVTGGISMLYAWVWMSWAQFYSGDNAAVAAGSGSIGGVLQQIVFWIAPLAPVLWFITALALHRHEPRRLAIAVGVGLLVTFPIPMVASMGAAL